MADDRIDIEINDKIDGNISKKLRDIATGADKGEASVLKLKAALATVNDTPAKRLKDATDATTNSLNAEMNAQSKLTTARNASTNAIDAEIAKQQRLAKVIDETIARQRAQTAAMQGTGPIAAAVGSPGLASAQSAEMRGGKTVAEEAAAVAASTKVMEAAVAHAETTSVSRFGRIKLAALGLYDTLRDGFAQQSANFKGFFGSGGASTMEKEAVALEKVGVHAKGSSTAIREMLVLAREGSRGDLTRMAGSASILANALGLLKLAIPVAIAGLVAFGAAKISLNTETEKKSLRDYADTLGLTDREMRKLTDTTVDANGKLHEHNVLQVTSGDILNGTITTIKQGISSLAQAWGLTTKEGIAATNSAINGLRRFFDFMVGGVYAFAKFLYTEVYNLFTAAQNVGTLVGNAVYLMFANVANGVIDLFNGVGKVINMASNAVGKGDLVKPIDHINTTVTALTKGLRSLKGENFFGDVNAGAAKMDAGFTKLGNNIKQAARDRIKAEADAIKANRNPGKGHKEGDPKTKDDYLNDENKKLDDELSRMHMLKDAREDQQKLDAIEEEFAKRRTPLNAAEIAGFKAKIAAISQYKYVQAEADKIYEAAISPQRTYNATIQAATELLHKGAISQDRWRQATENATRALAIANNPLLVMTETMKKAENAVKLYGNAVEQATYYDQLRQALLEKYPNMSLAYVKGVNAEVDALMKRNEELIKGKFIQSQVSAIVNPIVENRMFIQNKQNLYNEIDRLRQADVLKENEAERAKAQVRAKYNEIQLQGVSDTFGALATLSSSGNSKLAAIGKAAAVAQATIDGFVAVQKALGATTSPFVNMALAAAIAIKTGANVAAIVSTNVGSFDTGGQFMVDGRAGVDNNNISMNVSRGERVTIETPAQQRANANGGSSEVHVPVTIVNVNSEEKIANYLAGPKGKRVIFNHVRENPNEFKALMKGAG